MKKLNILPLFFLLFFIGCSETEKSQKYIFNYIEMKKNLKKYTLSNGPMDEFSCGMTSLVFSKEVLDSIKSNKKPNLMAIKNVTPTTIEVYKDKIVWNDLGQETIIQDNKVSINGPSNEKLLLSFVKNETNLTFTFKEKKLVCTFPFKTVD